MADHLRSELVLGALEMAVTHRRPPTGLIVHSDRGVQYASADTRQFLAAHGLVSSMKSGRQSLRQRVDGKRHWQNQK